MEAPTANNNNSKQIDCEYNNKKYILNLSYNQNLIISITCLDSKQTYINEFTIEKITEINKYFLMCDSIEDIFCELSNNISNIKNISFSNNNLILIILLPCQKNKEAKFILNIKNNSMSENAYNQLLLEHDKIIKEQNIEIKLLKDKILTLEKKISLLESFMNIDENKEKDFFEDERIKKLKKLIERKCHLKLLYQMTKDGSSCSTFHDKVDNKGPTITLFESEDGYKFGGYTSQSFQTDSKWIKDSDSFLFNFSNLKKFPIKKKDNDAIFLGSRTQYGPEFFDILVNSSDIKIGQIRVEHFKAKKKI